MTESILAFSIFRSFKQGGAWRHPTRYRRDLSRRFGDQAYAAEELVAELGAALLCADLNVTPVPRIDHAQYLAHWLKLLRSDAKAIFTAAAKASATVTLLHNLQLPTTSTPSSYDPYREFFDNPATSFAADPEFAKTDRERSDRKNSNGLLKNSAL